MNQQTFYAILAQQCDDTRKRTNRHTTTKRKPTNKVKDGTRKHVKTRSLHIAKQTE